jgi:imidazole glycerol-phosphate synthase subunit HisH
MSSTPHIVVVDYGLCNIYNVVRSFAAIGFQTTVTDDPAQIAQASHLVLPGVGSYRDGIAGLNAKGLIAPIQAFVQVGNPFLGICLGMQLMFDRSTEFGEHLGLGLIPGSVKRITELYPTNEKVPIVGWYPLKGNLPADRSILWNDGTTDQASRFYFVHSYMAKPSAPEHLEATYTYNDYPITAAVRKDNAFGVQFHPEKSGPVGLDILKRFVQLN